MPVDVRIEAFNPLIPCDPDLSGIPVAVLRFVLTNKTAGAITASVCGSLQNFIGTDGSSGVAKANRNTFRNGEGIQGIFLRSHGAGCFGLQAMLGAQLLKLPEKPIPWPN